MRPHEQENGNVGRTFGTIGLVLAGLLALLLWGLAAAWAALAYVVGTSTGTVSGFGLTMVLLAAGLLVPLGLLAGAAWCALAPRRQPSGERR